MSTLRVVVETGPKEKRVVAVAPDWPGLERGAKHEADALARLQDYLPRYAVVARQAGLDGEFDTDATLDVVEHYPGPGSTDFWGISFGFSSIDHEPVSVEDLARELALMQAAWEVFDAVRGRVSAEMRKGPRGGGRDRDQIAGHVFATERDWATKLGVQTPDGAMSTVDGLADHRRAYCEAIKTFHAEGRPARKWPLRYLIRHTAYHTLDHAWEMKDKDLSTG